MSVETHTQDSYNHSGLVVFILSMVISVGFFIVVLVFHHGVDLKEVYEAKPAAGATAAPAADANAKPGATAGAPENQPEKK
jgi:hypothetical protein